MTNKRFLFSILATTVLTAKVIHIYANSKALPARHLLLWTYSFFAQDLLFLSVLRSLLGSPLFLGTRPRGWLALLGTILVTLFSAYSTIISFVSICFFSFNGSELHYRNVGFVKDSSARAVLLSGLFTASLVTLAILAFSRLVQKFLFAFFALPEDALFLCVRVAKNLSQGRRPLLAGEPVQYESISTYDSDSDSASDSFEKPDYQRTDYEATSHISGPWYLSLFRGNALRCLSCAFVSIATILQLGSFAMRPPEGAFTYLSWTAPLLPFVDFDNSSPHLKNLASVYGTGIGYTWDNITALDKPSSFTWLPQGKKLSGFEDWYGDGTQHYHATQDPLRNSDAVQKLLPELKGHLQDVNIRHVLYIFLESTRKDVFPIKKDELIWNRLAETFDNKALPAEVVTRLSTLTPTASYLTGDYEDGFGREGGDENKRRGGLNFHNAYTAATYTKKSETGALCGVHPLVADFNREFEHHIYQPCLPHIFDAFSALNDNITNDSSNTAKDFTSFKWRSYFMESTTINYDNSGPLFEKIGFPPENTIAKEYLKSPSAKFGKVDLPDINYFGMEETPLKDYIKDAFSSATDKDERVFLTHITSTSHHPYNMPDNETYVPLGHGDALKDLSHYVNAIGYDDRWLASILDILEEQGVANETLVVLHGDHGLSIPENDVLASYYNPNVGCDLVPLVLSHPRLPSIQIEAPVSTVQILPTILDLLAETQSLSGDAMLAAQDLTNNYEGTSLIRTASADGTSNDGTSQTFDNWQFIIMNPGRAMVGIRDKRQIQWRLVVPVLANTVWRFTDLSVDPREADPTISFSFSEFLALIEQKHGIEAAEWAEEGAFIARWWVEENSKRWQFGPYSQ
jgi:hypothetical protein